MVFALFNTFLAHLLQHNSFCLRYAVSWSLIRRFVAFETPFRECPYAVSSRKLYLYSSHAPKARLGDGAEVIIPV